MAALLLLLLLLLEEEEEEEEVLVFEAPRRLPHFSTLKQRFHLHET